MQIKPSITDLEAILSGYETRYKIPKYQRDYSWKYNEEVEELWNDIIFSANQDFEYFIGNVVLNANGNIDSSKEFDVVDGQQRLTTFSILFQVIRNYCNHFLKTQGNDAIFDKWRYNEQTYEKILRIENRVRDRLVYYGEPNNYYLELNQKDQPIFRDEILENSTILKNEEDLKILNNESRLIKTKKALSRKILEEFIYNEFGIIELDKFVHHLNRKLKINEIKVGEDYDAYLLFESLNSKGMSLSQSDLIKNKVLMLCNGKEDSLKITIQQWESIGDNLRLSRNGIVDFFYYVWLTFENSSVTKKTLYKNVRHKLNHYTPPQIVEYTGTLQKISRTFIIITSNTLTFPSTQYKSKSLDQYLAEIQSLKYSICIPSILYSKYSNLEITKDLAFYSISYLFRNITIGELQVRKAKDTFDQVLKYLKEGQVDSEVLKNIFVQNNEVNDEEFVHKFLQKTFSNQLGKYVLTKIYQHQLGYEMNLNEVDLEHILPYSYEKYWSDFNFSGRKPEDVIGNIGNLTLLNPGNNRSIKNYVFSKKIPYYKKRTSSEDLESTTIPLTYEIHEEFLKAGGRSKYPQNEFWDLSKIERRAEKFSSQINKIWTL